MDVMFDSHAELLGNGAWKRCRNSATAKPLFAPALRNVVERGASSGAIASFQCGDGQRPDWAMNGLHVARRPLRSLLSCFFAIFCVL